MEIKRKNKQRQLNDKKNKKNPPSSNYFPIDNIPPKFQLRQSSSQTTKNY